MASLENPVYTVYIVASGTKYNVSGAVVSLKFTDQKAQFSKSVRIELANAKVGNMRLTSLIRVRDRVYIYADDGEKSDEVWRGFVWTRNYKSSLASRNFDLKCYDNLIFMQESEESKFFESGKSTKSIVSSLCSDWGVSLQYNYESITHAKLALRGGLSDIITDDVLNLVKDRTGKKYVIISEKDVMYINGVGKNSTVYTIKAGNNAVQTASECTMDGMTTKVVILGKADDDDRRPVEATVSGNTSKYGTLQKLIDRDENTELADAKKEAQSIIDEDGEPKWEYEISAPDIPWIRKGDKVNVSAGDLTKSYIVIGVDRDISLKEKRMLLTLENV